MKGNDKCNSTDEFLRHTVEQKKQNSKYVRCDSVYKSLKNDTIELYCFKDKGAIIRKLGK